MASSLLAALQQMQTRIAEISAEMDSLREQNRLLTEENQSLRRDLADTALERDKAKLDAQFLAVSHKLADNPDTLVDARRLIAGLIRNIDRCIEMLKE